MQTENALRYHVRRSRLAGRWMPSPWAASVAAVWLLTVALGASPNVARANLPRDWMAGVQPEGADLFLDLILPGVQATLENRLNFYGDANQFTSRINALATAGFVESQLDLDMRVLVLAVGGSVGVRDTFRLQTFMPGESISIEHRLERELESEVTNGAWGFAEARVTLSVPFNDHMVLNSINRYRIEGRPQSSFDWRLAVVHDGEFLASETMFLLKGRSWGAIGPVVELLQYELGGQSRTQINWGAMLTTRLGWLADRDVLLIRALVNVGGPGIDASQTYGLHYLSVPMNLTVAYRAVLPVWRSD